MSSAEGSDEPPPRSAAADDQHEHDKYREYLDESQHFHLLTPHYLTRFDKQTDQSASPVPNVTVHPIDVVVPIRWAGKVTSHVPVLPNSAEPVVLELQQGVRPKLFVPFFYRQPYRRPGVENDQITADNNGSRESPLDTSAAVIPLEVFLLAKVSVTVRIPPSGEIIYAGFFVVWSLLIQKRKTTKNE